MIGPVVNGVRWIGSFFKGGTLMYAVAIVVPMLMIGAIVYKKNVLIRDMEGSISTLKQEATMATAETEALEAVATGTMMKLEALRTELSVLHVIKDDIQVKYSEVESKYEYLSRLGKSSRDQKIAPALLVILEEVNKIEVKASSYE